MRVLSGLLIATISLVGARGVHALIDERQTTVRGEAPYAPSPTTAPFVSLGYREVTADLLFIRLIGYLGNADTSAIATAELTEAIIALDPKFYDVYEYGAIAMMIGKRDVTREIYLRAIAVLERGAKEFPNDYKLPFLAGQIYTNELKTDDPIQRRAWDEAGTLLVESSLRKPGAPATVATWAATMRTRFGQRERAIAGLREMILMTSDDQARQRLLEKLAEIDDKDADAIRQELLEMRSVFLKRWMTERPAISATMFVLIGPRPSPRFDMADLATGGRDLYGADEPPPLEPLVDPPLPPPPAPVAP
ncbi:MAG: hypothetical protein H0T79_15090 [Deltaproteobacteria bacterium]|nr:hypothetical protein [Deltaproteobacteria bacterium]